MGKLFKRRFKRGVVYFADLRSEGGGKKSLHTGDYKVAVVKLRDAELELHRARLAEADPAEDQATRVLGAAIDYLLKVGCNDRSPATREMYEQKGRHLMRLIGDVDIESITREQVAQYAKVRTDEGAHSNTINKELITLRRALTLQHELRPLPRAPSDVMIQWRGRYKPITRNLTPPQFAALLGAAPAARRLWLVLAVFTGANLSEMHRIDRADVDLVGGQIRIRGTKRESRNRLVPIPPPLRPWLERHMLESALADGSIAPGPVVAPWKNPTHQLERYCKKAGVPRVTSNDLRRTYGSWLKQAGVDSKAVADLMGHASTKMVDTVYGRLTPEVYAAATARMPAIVVIGGEQLALPMPPPAARLSLEQQRELAARAISAVDHVLIDLAEAAPIGMIKILDGEEERADGSGDTGGTRTALLPTTPAHSKPPRRRRPRGK